MLKVKDLPLDDRPREKLLLRGASSLSDSELIAILLRTGTKGKSVIEIAQSILAKGNLATLATNSVESFTKIKLFSNNKAFSLPFLDSLLLLCSYSTLQVDTPIHKSTNNCRISLRSG